MKRLFAVTLFVSLLSGCVTIQRDINSELNELRERVVHLERGTKNLQKNDKQIQKILGAIILKLSKPSKKEYPATY
jgi:hypothetical protein